MKKLKIKAIKAIAILAVVSCSSHLSRAQDFTAELSKLIAPDAKVELVTDQCKFTEGPIADVAGRVLFTDQPNNRIMVVELDGSVKTFLEKAGRSNGMYFDQEWNLITCADEKNELWLIRGDGSHHVLVKEPDGKKLNGPNDLWISKDDIIYFTDPFYKRDWWEHSKAPREMRGLYSCDIDGSNVKLLDGNFKQPNGIIGDQKSNLLYVADINDRKIYVYPLNSDGSLGERKLFCEEPSDGMTIDDQGNVYLTNSQGVCVYSPEGKKLGVIPTGEGWTANVCFGGADRKTLFITASDSVYRIKMNVSGNR